MRTRWTRPTLRGHMIRVAIVAALLTVTITCLNWMRCPRIDVRIFNESSTPVYDLQLKSFYEERTARYLRPGGLARTVIQYGESNMFLSYRNSNGVSSRFGPFSEESGNRGRLEFHIIDSGVNVVCGIYHFDAPPILGIRQLPATAQMAVE